MKWTTATALFLALAAGGVGVTAVMNREPKSPADILADIEREMSGPAFDQDSAVKRLASALEDERVEEGSALEAKLTRIRADIYRKLGMYSDARADLEQLRSSESAKPEVKKKLELEIVRLMSDEEVKDDALARLTPLVSEGSDFGEAWALRGQLEKDIGEEQMAAAYAVAQANLASTDAEAIRDTILELASRSPDDRRREALIGRLGKAFYGGSDMITGTVVNKITEPRLYFKRARADFAHALETIVDPQIVVAFGELLERAGQIELSIKLHRAAQNIPEVRNDPDALAAFLGQLMKSNRIAEGVRVLRSWDYTNGGSLEFYRSAGEVFYRAGEYSALQNIAKGLDNTGAGIGDDYKNFFYYVPTIHGARKATKPKDLQRFRVAAPKAIASLKRFATDTENPEPFLGARAEAWFWVAEGHAFMGNVNGERGALVQALAEASNPSSDHWVRLAELRKLQNPIPWKDVERALSEAMNIDPARTAELAPDWYQAGLQQLERYNEKLDDIIGQLTRSGFSALNPDVVGPSVMTQIAGHELAIGDNYKAIRAATAAREQYRNLVPPLDIIIRAKLANTQARDPKTDIIERIEAAGIDAQVESFMSQLDGGRLDGEELVRAILAAPERFGKAAVARYYLTLNDPARAGEALVDIKDATAPPELRLLRANLLVEGDKFNKALEELAGLESDPQLRASALLLKLEASIGAGKIRTLDPIAAQFRELDGSTPEQKKEVLKTQLAAIDQLSMCGRIDLALANLEPLDKNAASRTPEFYRRKLLIDALTLKERGPVPTQETILRAEPYLRDGTPEITAIVVAVAERKWTDLPGLVDRLLESKFRPTAKQEAALELLGERLQSGTRAAEDGLRSFPRDAEWAFLSSVAASLVDARIELPEWFGPRAARDAGRLLRGRQNQTPQDPRDALVLYLMSSEPEWSPWVMPRIGEMIRGTGSSLWTLWLRARVFNALDDKLAEAKTIARLTEDHPRFGPGHDAAIDLFERMHPTAPLHNQLVRARRIRLQSLGEELIANPIEIRMANAGELARRGKNIEAIQELEPAIRSGGIGVTEGRLILGLLMTRAEQYSLAATQLEAALAEDPGVFREIVIDSLLNAVRKSVEAARSNSGVAQRGQLSEEDAMGILRDLSARYPLDPMVKLTELQLMTPAVESDRSVLAEKSLDRLFIESGRKPLDQLRRGCTKAWIQYLAPIAPSVAEKVLERDLVLEPGNLDLWQLSGQVAEIQRDLPAAKKYYETLMAIDPRAETAFALAAIMIQEGSDPIAAKKILADASKQMAGGSNRAVYLQTVAELRDRNLDGPPRLTPQLSEIVPRLGELWNSRQRVSHEVDPVDLGLLYADAMFRRLTSIERAAETATRQKRSLKNQLDLARKKAFEAGTEPPALPTAEEEALAEQERAAEREERSLEYKKTLARLRQLLPELLEVVEVDPTAIYSRDVIQAMNGLVERIAERDRAKSLLDEEPLKANG